MIDRAEGYAFGFAEKDGYCGWLPLSALIEDHPVSHWVAVPGSHLYAEPREQAHELSACRWREVRVLDQTFASRNPHGFFATQHLIPLGHRHADPVAVAESFRHTPLPVGRQLPRRAGRSGWSARLAGIKMLATQICRNRPGHSV